MILAGKAQSDFGDRTLALGWGINFKYPQTNTHNILPKDVTDYIAHSTNTGYDHAINNWVYDVIPNKGSPHLYGYIQGRKTITNKKSYEFNKHNPTDPDYNFFWCVVDGSATPQ